MEAKELRIGNLVKINNPARPKDQNKVAVIHSIAEHIDSYAIGCRLSEENQFGQFIEFLKPIELTEEWLLRFDLHRHHADYSNGYIMLKNVPFEKDGFTFKLFPKELGSAEEPMEAQKIKYVHQLQNLYFAIIGSELTIDF